MKRFDVGRRSVAHSPFHRGLPHAIALSVEPDNAQAPGADLRAGVGRCECAREAVPDDLLEFKPHEKTNPIRTILVHQLLSERRFFGRFVGTEESPVEELRPSGEKPTVQAYIDKYLELAISAFSAASAFQGFRKIPRLRFAANKNQRHAMSKIFRNRWLRWALVVGVLIALGCGIYHVEEPEPVAEIDTNGGEAVGILNEGRHLATLSPLWIARFRVPSRSGPLQIWDITNGVQVGNYFKDETSIAWPTFSGDGRFFAAETAFGPFAFQSAQKSDLLLLDIASGATRKIPLPGNEALPVNIRGRAFGPPRFSPSGNMVARRADFESLRVFDSASGDLIHELAGASDCEWITLDDDCLIWRTGGRDNGIVHLKVWNATDRNTKQLQFRSERQIDYMKISSDGRWLATTCPIQAGHAVEVFDLKTGRPIGKAPIGGARNLEFSPDGRFLALDSGEPGNGHSREMLDIATMKILWKRDGLDRQQCYFSHDSRTIFERSGQPSRLVARNSTTGSVFATFDVAPGEVKMTADHRALVVQQWNGDRETPSWTRWLQKIPWLNDRLRRSNDVVVVLDADRCVERFRLFGFNARSSLLSENGRYLATTHMTDDRTITCCWDVNAWKPLHWPIGVPAALGGVIVLVAWWRGRRSRKGGGPPCPS